METSFSDTCETGAPLEEGRSWTTEMPAMEVPTLKMAVKIMILHPPFPLHLAVAKLIRNRSQEAPSTCKSTPRTCRHCRVQYGAGNALYKHLRAGCEAAPVKRPTRMTKALHSGGDVIHRPSHKERPATPVQSVESGMRITPNEPSHHFDESLKSLSLYIDEPPKYSILTYSIRTPWPWFQRFGTWRLLS